MSILNPLYINRIGRKTSLRLGCVPVIISWIILSWKESFGWLCAARAISGLGDAINLAVSVIYIAEISDKRVRGSMSAFVPIAGVLGKAIIHGTSPFLTLKQLGYIALAIPATFVLSSFWITESPYYFARKGEHENALEALRSLRPCSLEKVKHELEEIKAHVDKEDQTRGSVWMLLTSSSNRKALFIICMMEVTMDFCGMTILTLYSEKILWMTGLELNAKAAVLITDCFQILAVFVGGVMMDHMGRRKLYMISGVATSVVLSVLTTLLYLFDSGYNLNGSSWVLALTIGVHYIVATMGLLCVPFAVKGELFQMEVKILATSFATLFGSALHFFVAKFFPIISELIGMHYVFLAFSLITIFSTCVIFFILPETKGKSLAEVQGVLKKKKKKKQMIDKEYKDENVEERGTFLS